MLKLQSVFWLSFIAYTFGVVGSIDVVHAAIVDASSLMQKRDATLESEDNDVISRDELALLKEQLKENTGLGDELHNGLSGLSLKNDEHYVWLFLGAVSVLGLLTVGKVFSMLSAKDNKEASSSESSTTGQGSHTSTASPGSHAAGVTTTRPSVPHQPAQGVIRNVPDGFSVRVFRDEAHDGIHVEVSRQRRDANPLIVPAVPDGQAEAR